MIFYSVHIKVHVAALSVPVLYSELFKGLTVSDPV